MFSILPGSNFKAQDQTSAIWKPKNTRVFVACVAQFKREKAPSCSTDDRLDKDLVTPFKERGIPADQIVYLQDQTATTANVRRRFGELLQESYKGETLIFYFGSDGSYDADKGTYAFSTFL